MKIRKVKPEDCEQVNRLMELLIDEVYGEESQEIRKILKANFTQDALKELCREEHTILHVVEIDEKVTAFVYGSLFHQVMTIYWVYCLREYRARGIIKKLLKHLEKELIEMGVYKIEIYAYAKNKRFLDFLLKMGFEKGVLIEKSMFGIKIQNLFKYISDPTKADKEKKIKILGEAGQGVKLMSITLASILAQLGNEVSLNLEYDSAVRSGNISADLIYSDEPITNPIIDEADILIKFTRTREWFPARNLIIDESICGTEEYSCTIRSKKGAEYGFQDVAISKFGSKIFINMIALGRILKYIGINILLINIKDLLPPKSVEQNLAAIKYGFNYRDDL